MASLSRRIRRNMARPAIRQIRRNRRALSQAVQPLARGMAEIGKEFKLVDGRGITEDQKLEPPVIKIRGDAADAN